MTSGALQTVARPIADTEWASSLCDIAIAASTCRGDGGGGEAEAAVVVEAVAAVVAAAARHLQPHLDVHLDAAGPALGLGEHELAQQRRRT